MAGIPSEIGSNEVLPGTSENIILPSAEQEEDEVDKWIPEGKDPSILEVHSGLNLKEIPEV